MKDTYEDSVICYFNDYGFDYCNIMYANEDNMLVTCNIKSQWVFSYLLFKYFITLIKIEFFSLKIKEIHIYY